MAATSTKMKLRFRIWSSLIILTCLTSSTFAQESSDTTIFKIDPDLKEVVKQKIWTDEGRPSKYTFASKLNAEFYQNDQLTEYYKDSTDNSFWARYWWHNDTLTLTANVGQLSSIGFIADIYNGQATVYINQCAHENKRYKIGLNDTLKVCIKVPCIYADLQISSIPDSTKDEEISGFISFKGRDYYYQDQNGLTKLRANMTFYFKSSNYEFYLRKKHRI